MSDLNQAIPPDVDMLALVTAINTYVQSVQLPVNLYLSNPQRDPLELPAHQQMMAQLANWLRSDIYRRFPMHIYQGHYNSTRDLQEHLRSIEAGFSESLDNQPGLVTSRHEIPALLLQELIRSKVNGTRIAAMLGVSTKTVERRLDDLGIHRRADLLSTSDEDLKSHVIAYLYDQNELGTGVQMISGHLRSIDVPHTREQLRAVVNALRPDDWASRTTGTIQRREYFVPFINALWHIDGHHKLIRWKFVTHAGIDGKSHLVTFIDVSDNNRADTVRDLFLRGTQRWGWPQRVRADYGGENLGVRELMETHREHNRGSFIAGKSVHNIQIERLWVDVRRGFVEKYIRTFRYMEQQQTLDPQNAMHLYCLHFVYLDALRESANRWAESWNHHSMSNVEGLTPMGQWYIGGVAARQNGFALNFYPWGSEEEEERAWQQEMGDGRCLVEAEDYRPQYQGTREYHTPRDNDPHVHVGRFQDDLPDELYGQHFLSQLRTLFPPTGRQDPEFGIGRYTRVLMYVEDYLLVNYPELFAPL
ncbi:hypothetical protein NCC49_006065 [Naganishia albida]|nr:hypothetical protein NCC49_006065 [Naganishia albida]